MPLDFAACDQSLTGLIFDSIVEKCRRKAHSVIDREALRDLQDVIGGSRDDLLELVAEFLHDAPCELAAMATAAAASDIEAVRRGAHSLKSNGRDLGALVFARLCADLEADLNTHDKVSDPISRVQAILDLWPQIRSALIAETVGREGES